MNNRERKRAKRRARFVQSVEGATAKVASTIDAYGGSATPDREYPNLSRVVVAFDGKSVDWLVAPPEFACQGPKSQGKFEQGYAREKEQAAERLAADCKRIRAGLPVRYAGKYEAGALAVSVTK